ncbi:winged-helix domain-containing protein [Halopenitus sp. POP-27]|uniref:winged-helix domain-containing protein n=1 Tax=Halopenitus sp. POP-27 TaxID=2994425 RepID=UPI002468E7D1|nr:winged-helix domain-containing protein [Halopenitus sp. POP-27]
MRRKRGEWQTSLDDEILEILASSELVLSPSIIAYNLDRSREGVASRIRILTNYGLIEKEQRGKYKITESGRNYLKGELDASQLEEES